MRSCATHSDVVKQPEGGGAAAGAGGDAVGLPSDGAALPLTAAVLSCSHHLAVSVLHVHRPFHTIPGKSTGVVRKVDGNITPSTNPVLLSVRERISEVFLITHFHS